MMVKKRAKNKKKTLTRMPRPGMFLDPYNATYTLQHKFRFGYTPATSALVTYTITPAKLCSLWCIGTVVNTTGIAVFETVRLIKVKLYATPPQNGTLSTVSITADAGALGIEGANKMVSHTSMGMTDPAVCTFVPEPKSQVAQWQTGDTTNGTNQLFSFTIEPGTTNQAFIIDVTVELRPTTNSRTSANTIALTTAVVGAFYYLALDNKAGNNASVSSNWVPIPGILPTTL